MAQPRGILKKAGERHESKGSIALGLTSEDEAMVRRREIQGKRLIRQNTKWITRPASDDEASALAASIAANKGLSPSGDASSALRKSLSDGALAVKSSPMRTDSSSGMKKSVSMRDSSPARKPSKKLSEASGFASKRHKITAGPVQKDEGVEVEVPKSKAKSADTLVDISNRGLKTLASQNFAEGLTKINASNNQIENIKGVRLPSSLTALLVNDNHLKKIARLPLLPNLVLLNASSNALVKLKLQGACPTLSALLLKGNDLKLVPKDLPISLRTLVLSNNKITQLSNLGHLTLLKKLSLSHNHIQELKSSDLSRNEALAELRLNDNQLTSLPLDLKANPRINFLDIGNNKIASRDALKALLFLKQLRNLNIKGNPICSDPLLKGWLCTNVPSLKILDGEKVNQTTDELEKTASRKGVPVVREEDDDALDEENFIASAKPSEPVIKKAQSAPKLSLGKNESEDSSSVGRPKTKPLTESKSQKDLAPSGWGKNGNGAPDVHNFGKDEEDAPRARSGEGEDDDDESKSGWGFTPKWQRVYEAKKRDKEREALAEQRRAERGAHKKTRPEKEKSPRSEKPKSKRPREDGDDKERPPKRAKKEEKGPNSTKETVPKDQRKPKAPTPQKGEERAKQVSSEPQNPKKRKRESDAVEEAPSKKPRNDKKKDTKEQSIPEIAFGEKTESAKPVRAAPSQEDSGVVAVKEARPSHATAPGLSKPKAKFALDKLVADDDPFGAVSHW